MDSIVKFDNTEKIDLIELFESYVDKDRLCELSDDEVSDAIIKLNSYVISIAGTESSSYSQHLFLQCDRFAVYIYNLFFRQSLFDTLYDKCDGIPCILNTGIYAKTGREDAEFVMASQKLNSDFKKSAADITKYILSMKNTCLLTLTFEDDKHYEFFTIDTTSGEDKFKQIYFNLMRIAYTGGAIIITELCDDKDMVCGFYVNPKDRFETLSAKELKTYTLNIEDNEVYTRPSIILSRGN